LRILFPGQLTATEDPLIMPTASDYMVKKVLVLAPDTEIHAARRLLVRNEISGAPVLDEGGDVVGILTERDIIGAIYGASYHRDLGGRVADSMTTEVQTIEADMEIVAAIELFLQSRYRRFPVMDQARMVGLLSRRDALRAIEDLW
jgi:CBS domain-containing protein